MFERRILGQKNLDALFGNIVQIVKVNKDFLDRLIEIYDHSPVVDAFGSIFLTLVGTLIIFRRFNSFSVSNFLYIAPTVVTMQKHWKS